MDGHGDCQTEKADRERQISYDVTYMWNINNEANELIYKIDSETQTSNLWLPKGKLGRDK